MVAYRDCSVLGALAPFGLVRLRKSAGIFMLLGERPTMAKAANTAEEDWTFQGLVDNLRPPNSRARTTNSRLVWSAVPPIAASVLTEDIAGIIKSLLGGPVKRCGCGWSGRVDCRTCRRFRNIKIYDVTAVDLSYTWLSLE